MPRKTISNYLDSIDLVEPVPIKLLKCGQFSLRTSGSGKSIEELTCSIKKVGLLQPIIVRPLNGDFQVIAGHRRLEACRRLRWKQIPGIIKELSDKEAFEVCITENVQKETFTPIEEAKAFKAYVDEHRWGSMTELAERIGKSEAYVSHRLQLLTLPEGVIEKISTRVLSPSVGRELAWLDDENSQEALANEVHDKGLSVRETHELVQITRREQEARTTKEGKDGEKYAFLADFEVPSPRDHRSKSLDRAILVMRMTLIRLDRIIEEAPSKNVRDFLVEKRLALHTIIDECLKAKLS